MVRGSVDIFEPLEQAEMLPMRLQQPEAMLHLAKVLGELHATSHQLNDFYLEASRNPNVAARDLWMDREIPLCLHNARWGTDSTYLTALYRRWDCQARLQITCLPICG